MNLIWNKQIQKPHFIYVWKAFHWPWHFLAAGAEKYRIHLVNNKHLLKQLLSLRFQTCYKISLASRLNIRFWYRPRIVYYSKYVSFLLLYFIFLKTSRIHESRSWLSDLKDKLRQSINIIIHYICFLTGFGLTGINRFCTDMPQDSVLKFLKVWVWK